MEICVRFRKWCQIERSRRYIIIVGMVAVSYLMLQYIMLPYGIALKSLLPDNEIMLSVRSSSADKLSVKSDKDGEVNPSDLVGLVKQDDNHGNGDLYGVIDHRLEESNGSRHEVIASEGKGGGEFVGLDKISGPKNVDGIERSDVKSGDSVGKPEQRIVSEHQISQNSSLVVDGKPSLDGIENDNVDKRNHMNPIGPVPKIVTELPQNDLGTLGTGSTPVMGNRRRKKKVRAGMPPVSVVSIDEMNRRLARHLSASSKMKPQWSSLHERDKEMIDAKSKIISAPVSLVDKELYVPVFRNISRFIRSYELMEQILKVYVYSDGEKPIFHQPILKGLYASEGWFMKLMEANKHFVVKNPDKAHLFYMPFSSRMLEYALYVPGSHNRTKLRQFVKGYAETIAGKYPFWNRTGGTDHFAVACHDWALYETRHHMENSIKALCNADVTIGFKIGRDVSLPETFVRYARNPLRDLGGKPPSKRNILAFYAGNIHGYLRPILLKHWKDKDPDMRIYDVLPNRIAKKMNYMQHMKSSKYCICPKGYEVNSPRVVESIFYECVPVIISDNFVPPFFEILNWEAFSVIVAEKDIPNLKNILLSIPEAKYLEMQLAVRKVQRHFLWHARPVKYDLFHMTLHSIWYSRVFQIQRQ